MKERVLYYFHIPKTAGTALNQYIMTHYDPKDTIYGQIDKYGYYSGELDLIPDKELNDLKYVSGHVRYKFIDRLKNDKISFTIIRDPIERTLSLYSFYKNNFFPSKRNNLKREFKENKNVEHFYNVIMKKNATFEEFLNDNLISRLIANYQTFSVSFDGKYAEREERFNKKYLEIAKNRLREFTFVGTTERINDVLLVLANYCRWYPHVMDYKVNQSSKRIKKEDLSQSTINKLYELLEFDMELHQYANNLLDEKFKNIKYDMVAKKYMDYISEKYPKKNINNINKEDLYFISGWHDVEYDGTRWSGPNKISIIFINTYPVVSDKKMKLLLGGFLSKKIINTLSIYINGVKMQYYKDKSQKIFEMNVSKEIINSMPLVEIKLEIDEIDSPKFLGINTDRRKLGFILSGINFSSI